MFKRISIYDFDGTLCLTPDREEGSRIWKEKLGMDFPHSGWWGRKETLDTKIFEIDRCEWVYRKYLEDMASDSTLVVLVTGRHVGIAKEVKKVLEKCEYKMFDEYHFNNKGKTDVFKIEVFDNLLLENPEVQEITIYEDRADHIHLFHTWAKRKDSKAKVNIIDVKNYYIK